MEFVATNKNNLTVRAMSGNEYDIEYDTVTECYYTVPGNLEFNTLDETVNYLADYDDTKALAIELMNNGLKCADCLGNMCHLWNDWNEIVYIYCDNDSLLSQFVHFTACMTDIYKADKCLLWSNYQYRTSALFQYDGNCYTELDGGLAEFIKNMLK